MNVDVVVRGVGCSHHLILRWTVTRQCFVEDLLVVWRDRKGNLERRIARSLGGSCLDPDNLSLAGNMFWILTDINPKALAFAPYLPTNLENSSNLRWAGYYGS